MESKKKQSYTKWVQVRWTIVLTSYKNGLTTAKWRNELETFIFGKSIKPMNVLNYISKLYVTVSSGKGRDALMSAFKMDNLSNM